MASTLTGFYPWGRHALSERVSVWGVAGYGAGALTLTPEGADGNARAPIRTDMDLMMGAPGLRGVLVAASATGGLELAVKTDAMGVRTSTAKAPGLAASEAEVSGARKYDASSRAAPYQRPPGQGPGVRPRRDPRRKVEGYERCRGLGDPAPACIMSR